MSSVDPQASATTTRPKTNSCEWDKDLLYQDPCASPAAQLVMVDGAWTWLNNMPNPERMEEIKSFAMRATDTVVASFSKSGTTWVQDIVLRIKAMSPTAEQPLYKTNTTVSNPADPTPGANIESMFPYLENVQTDREELASRASPRYIKTHLPYQLLPRDIQQGVAKMIYVARNPKDVCVSYYHFYHLIKPIDYKGTFEHFFDHFITGKRDGPWMDHVKGFWEQRHRDSILFVIYEELHKDGPAVVRRIAEFLSTSLSPRQVDEIVAATSFDVMKDNKFVNYSWHQTSTGLMKENNSGERFMRKGIVGDWKNHFTTQMSEAVDKECIEPLKQLGLNFD